MSQILSSIQDFFTGVMNFFKSLGTLISFLWDMIMQLDDMLIMVTSASSNIPLVFTILPTILYTFASSILIVAVLYLILGRNK